MAERKNGSDQKSSEKQLQLFLVNGMQRRELEEDSVSCQQSTKVTNRSDRTVYLLAQHRVVM